MNELTLTRAQQIDPLLNFAAGQHDFAQLEQADRSFGAMGKLSARLLIATASMIGVSETTDLFSEAEVAHADYQCSRFDPGAYRVDYTDANGAPATKYMCPDAPTPTTAVPTTPTTTSGSGGGGSSGGGSGGGGSSGGGSGGGGSTVTQPTSPPKPSFEDILAFVGCSEEISTAPELAVELNNLKGVDGSGRLAVVVDDCPLDFYEEAGILPDYGRPSTNWEAIIANPDANVTPNVAQTQAVNVYLKAEWDRLNAPATTVAPETTTETTELITTTTEIEQAPETTDAEETVAPASTVTTETEESGTTTTITTEAYQAPETTEAEETVAPASNNDSDKPSGNNTLFAIGIGAISALGLGGLLFVARRRRDHESQTPPQTFGGAPVAGN